ncbi:hypothetical protein ACHAXR_009620 [Thalassiosira sp. AJA248-18]
MDPPQHDPPEDEDLELSSLIEETASDHHVGMSDGQPGGGSGMDAPASSLMPPSRSQFSRSSRGRNVRRPGASGGASSSNRVGSLLSDVTTRFGFSSRQALLLVILAFVVLLLLIVASKTETAIEEDAVTTTMEVHHDHPSSLSSKWTSQSGGQYIGFHEPSLENIYGANHYFKPKGVGYPVAPRGGLHPIYMLEVGDGEKPNVHDVGFYDDYELSPYADKRLKLTDTERQTEQEEWKQKLQDIRDKFGYWDFKDDYREKNKGKDRPVVDWATVGDKKKDYNPLLGEIDKNDFPKGAWQTDDAYVTNFLKEGKKLIKRMLDAIHDEYGRVSVETQPGISIKSAAGDKTVGGNAVVAWMYEESFKALVKKLLNAMMTNDHFFVILGGHSAAAGHGNNFHQGYMMEFQRVMEPVFDRLGMVLVSANRAQGGMGTLQAAIAGTGIYGEKDFILWDSSMTEKDGKIQDFFWRQALLSGHRVPILFDMGGGKGTMDRMHNQVGAHAGGVAGGGMNPKYKNTTFDFSQPENKYNAVCWTDRVDVQPDVQYPAFGGQASWHPGNFVHQSTARKISLLFLYAMDEALTLWENTTSSEGNPLDGKHWHLQKEEEVIRDALRKVNATETECGKFFHMIPRLCTTPMRGAAEWAPRADPDHSSVRSLAKPAPNGYVPEVIGLQEQLYPGRDPHIPIQRVPKGETDVATIARSLPPRTSSERQLLLATTLRKRQHITNRALSQETRVSSLRAYHGRYLDGNSTKIIPGEGWAGGGHPAGYCDGTLNSVCYREKTSHCLLSGHNDARGYMKGDGLSGWLVLQLKDVTEGIFMSRMESYHEYKSNKKTDGWEAVNNGRDDGRRKLKKPPPPIPETFAFEVAVNGVIQYSWNGTEYQKHCPYLSYNNNICVLWNDEQWALQNKKEDVEFAIRIGGAGGRIAVMAFTHIYYA